MFSYVPAALPLFTRFCFPRFFKCLYINSVNQEMPVFIFSLFLCLGYETQSWSQGILFVMMSFL